MAFILPFHLTCVCDSIYDLVLSKLEIFCCSQSMQPQIKCACWWMPVRCLYLGKKKCERSLSTETNERHFWSQHWDLQGPLCSAHTCLKVNMCLLNMIHNTFLTESVKCGSVVGRAKANKIGLYLCLHMVNIIIWMWYLGTIISSANNNIKHGMCIILSQAPVAHTYNPSYMGGWDPEDHGLRPAWANSSWDPHLQKNQSKMDCRCSSSILKSSKCKALSSNPSTAEKAKGDSVVLSLRPMLCW
jgi:hypothetical protein